MNFLLPLLLLPLLACVGLLRGAREAAAARMVVATFALATLHLGTGSLVPGELAVWAEQGASHRLFVSLSTGIALGGLGLWSRRGWIWYLTAAPIGIALLVIFGDAMRLMPLILGVVIGALPLLVGRLAPRMILVAQGGSSPEPRRSDWVIVVLAMLAVASGSHVLLVFVPLMPLIDPALRTTRQGRRQMLLPICATLILMALLVHAISLGASPLALLMSSGFTGPLPGAVERVVGASTVAVAVLLVAPWPLHRFGPGILLVPAAMLLMHQVSGSIAPLGIASWLPLAAMVLVPSAIAALWRGHWANALGGIALLAAPLPTWPGLALVVLAAVALATVARPNPRRPDRISFPEAPWDAVLLALALALTTAAVLRHEVVLGSVLAVAVTAAVARPAWRLPPA